MIKITWGNLRDAFFMEAINKLIGKPMGYDLGMRFAILGKEIKKQQALLTETHECLLKKYGSTDSQKPGYYNIKVETRPEYEEEMKKIEAHDFTLRIGKFDSQKLNEIVPLSPQDLMVLDPMLLPFEVEPCDEAIKQGTDEKSGAELQAP